MNHAQPQRKNLEASNESDSNYRWTSKENYSRSRSPHSSSTGLASRHTEYINNKIHENAVSPTNGRKPWNQHDDRSSRSPNPIGRISAGRNRRKFSGSYRNRESSWNLDETDSHSRRYSPRERHGSVSPKSRDFHSSTRRRHDRSSYRRNRSRSWNRSRREYRYRSPSDISSDAANDRSPKSSLSSTSDKSPSKHYRRRSRERSSSFPALRKPKSNVILVRNISSTCTEEILEERIRAICIQKGFSLPNSVSIGRAVDYSVLDDQGQAINLADNVGYVEFPSSDASVRFMKVCGPSGSLFVANGHCPVEYATIANSQNRNKGPNVNDSRDFSATTGRAPYLSSVGNASNSGMIMSGFRGHPNDWTCPHCKYLNFSRRTTCGCCNVPKKDLAVAPTYTLDMITKPSGTFEKGSVLNESSSTLIIKDLNLSFNEDIIEKAITCYVQYIQDMYLVQSELQSYTIVGPAKSEKVNPMSPFSRIRSEKNKNDKSESSHQQTFIRFGPGEGRGFCFVDFKTFSAAQACLNQFHESGSFIGDTYVETRLIGQREKQVWNNFLDSCSGSVQNRSVQTKQHSNARSKSGNKSASAPAETFYTLHKFSLKELYATATSRGVSPFWEEYLKQWIGAVIPSPRGIPDITNFKFESTTRYLYDPGLNLYYDPTTQYYMNARGDYYIWDSADSCLKRVLSTLDSDMHSGSHEQNIKSAAAQNEASSVTHISADPLVSTSPAEQEIQGAQIKKETAASIVASLLANAKKTAQASKKAIKSMPIALTERTTAALAASPASGKSIVNGTHTDNDTKVTAGCDPCTSTEKPYGGLIGSLPIKKISGPPIQNMPSFFFDQEESPPEESELPPVVEANTNFSLSKKETPKNIEHICYVCIRKFWSAELLAQHEAYSQFHKKCWALSEKILNAYQSYW